MTAAQTDDYVPGDPARRVLGKPEEKPARVHRPQPPKPAPTAKVILADIRLRKQLLEDVLKEYDTLRQALVALKGI